MNSSVPEVKADYRWVLRYSSVAFVLLVLLQSLGVLLATPRFEELFANLGGELPLITTFVFNYYWVGSVMALAISVASALYILLNSRAAEKQLKIAYDLALVSLTAAFAWSGFVLTAVYLPIFNLSAAV